MNRTLFASGLALTVGFSTWTQAATLVLEEVSQVTLASTTAVDLTARGVLDWAYFTSTGTALASPQAPSNDKATGGSIISGVSQVGGTTLRGSSNGAVQKYTYSDGTSPTSGSLAATTQSFLFNSSLGEVGAGVSFALAGDNTADRFATLYLPGFQAVGKLTLTLAGTTTVIDTTQSFSNPSQGKSVSVYSVRYRPDSNSDLLSVQYTLESRVTNDAFAHVGVQAVTVSNVPEPGTVLYLAGSLGVAAGVIRRRR